MEEGRRRQLREPVPDVLKGQKIDIIGISDPGAFKLDHLQPGKLILSKQFSNFAVFILGSPIPYYPRERKEGRGRS